MVAIAPLVRRHRFIPERIALHAEELAYLWQRRRASLRSPDITLPDLTYLQERTEAHLQGLLVAGDELALLLDAFLHGDQRDEAFTAAWALLRSALPGNARKVLEAFAAARGPVLEGFADALATAPATHTAATLQAALAHGSPAHAAAAALALGCHRLLDARSPRLAGLLLDASPAIAPLAWRALRALDGPPAAAPLPFGEALRGPSKTLRQAALDVAVWRGEAWVLDVVRQLAAGGDEAGLGWYAVLCPADEQHAALALFAGRPVPQRTALAARLGQPAAIEAVLAWMADPDPVLAAAAAQAWEQLTGLSVEGERRALPAADPLEQDFPVMVCLPDLARARQQWDAHRERWFAGGRWCRGFDLQTTLTSEAQHRVGLQARWDFAARAAQAGTRLLVPPVV
ncbi:MAG: hypothetical protein L6Q65_01910 [Zoogloea sp.]|nr:hypothetical protein [Zoogloea sp.]